MNMVLRFSGPPDLPQTNLELLAKHDAFEILEDGELLTAFGLTAAQLDRLRNHPPYLARRAAARAFATTVEGMREINAYKQAKTEGQYWDRLMSAGLNLDTTTSQLIEAMKTVKRPEVRAADAGPGGNVVHFTINMPGAAPQQLSITPVVNAEVEA